MLLEYALTRYMRNYTARLTHTAGAGTGPAQSNKTVLDNPDTIPMLYLHIPFCKELCPFCTFYRIRFEEETARRYFKALRKQLRLYHDLGYRFKTAYFGGGTPTVLPDELAATLEELKKLWNIHEISIETNPSDLTQNNIQLFKDAGVNRLSVGVQSFQDNLLKSVNRIRKYGSGQDIRKRLSEIRGLFDTLNVDLIFGLEGQTLDDVVSDIETIKKLDIDQVTCYPLMKSGVSLPVYAVWKKRTRWEKQAYSTIRNILEPTYTPSSSWCFSRNKGMIDEYIVEHSSYAGAGSGAFGLENGTLAVNIFSVEKYIEMVETGANPIIFRHEFNQSEHLRYRLLMQMFGGHVDVPDLSCNQTLYRRLFIRALMPLLYFSGAAVRKAGRIVITKLGAYYSVLLMKLFFEGVGDLRHTCISSQTAGTILDTVQPRT